jgi:hypothetical protein
LALGVQHPNRLQLNNAELAEWFAYFMLHPFGEDVGHGMLAKIMAGLGGKTPATYMPKITDDGEFDSDMAQAVAFLQEEIRHGNC